MLHIKKGLQGSNAGNGYKCFGSERFTVLIMATMRMLGKLQGISGGRYQDMLKLARGEGDWGHGPLLLYRLEIRQL